MVLRLRLGHPAPGESLLGFAARLGGRNGWSSLQPFLNHLDLRFTTPSLLPFARHSSELLAEAGGLHQAALVGLEYSADHRDRVHFRSHVLSRWMIVTGVRRVCPECLIDNPIHRSVWDISPVPVCPRHCRLLVSTCPSCGCDLDWTTTSLVNCICGQDLRRVLTRAVGAGVVAAHQACISLLEGERTARELGFPAELPTTDLLHSMLRLGEFDMELVGAPQPTHMIREAGIVADLLGAGYRCLVPWPYAFRDLLCRLAERSLWRPGRFGMRKAFGQATVWFSRLEHTSQIGSLVGAEVERYLGNQAVVEPTRIRIGHLAQDARVITLTDAAHRLGCTRSKLKEVLLRAEVALDTSGPGRPALVRLEDVLAVQTERADLLGEREAARELGIGRVSAQAALRALGVEPNTGPASVLRTGLAWSKQALYRAIEDRLPTSSPTPFMATVKFGAALGRLVRAGYSRERACEYLLRDGVRPVGNDCQGRGAGGFVFAEEDLDRACLTGEGYSITEAGRRIGANSELVHLLVNRGLLAADATRQGRLVPETAIQAFLQTYVLPGQLQLEVGRHRGWAASQLVRLGCRPVLGPENGSRQLVFLASEVNNVLHKIR